MTAKPARSIGEQGVGGLSATELAVAWAMKVWQYNGGDPFYPRHQQRLLREAGFVRTAGSASTECRGTTEATRDFAELAIARNRSPTVSPIPA
jgi:hypothetical protein